MKLRTERDRRVRRRKGKEENLIFYFSENYQKTKSILHDRGTDNDFLN